MNVPTIEMSRDQAKAKLDLYLQDKHADAKETYAQCAKGYEALAAGKTLLHLDAAIRAAGSDDRGLPLLAIARADRKVVQFTWEDYETFARYDTRLPRNRHRGNPGTLVRRIEMNRRHGIRPGKYAHTVTGWAQVPLVPADVRPGTGQLSDWFMLWEVEQWRATPALLEPDRDPMLLRHLEGQLYEVIDSWELTDLERAVLAGALQPEVTP